LCGAAKPSRYFHALNAIQLFQLNSAGLGRLFTVFGSWSSEPRHLKAAIEFLRTTQQPFPFAEMVTHRFSLEQANEALNTTANWQSAKSVIVPG